jgi:hypothetical protein
MVRIAREALQQAACNMQAQDRESNQRRRHPEVLRAQHARMA